MKKNLKKHENKKKHKQTSQDQKTRYITVEEQEVENEPEFKTKKRRKVGNILNKKKQVLKSKRLNKPDEIHQYI